MITRDQWNALTPQQQYDYVAMLEDTVDSYALEGDTAESVSDILPDEAYPVLFIGADEPPIPHEPLAPEVRLSPELAWAIQQRGAATIEALSPDYHAQFMPPRSP